MLNKTKVKEFILSNDPHKINEGLNLFIKDYYSTSIQLPAKNLAGYVEKLENKEDIIEILYALLSDILCFEVVPLEQGKIQFSCLNEKIRNIDMSKHFVKLNEIYKGYPSWREPFSEIKKYYILPCPFKSEYYFIVFARDYTTSCKYVQGCDFILDEFKKQINFNLFERKLRYLSKSEQGTINALRIKVLNELQEEIHENT